MEVSGQCTHTYSSYSNETDLSDALQINATAVLISFHSFQCCLKFPELCDHLRPPPHTFQYFSSTHFVSVRLLRDEEFLSLFFPSLPYPSPLVLRFSQPGSSHSPFDDLRQQKDRARTKRAFELHRVPQWP